MASGVMMTTYSTKGTVHDFIKIKNYSAKVKSIRRQALDWDKIFAPPSKKYICMFNKELLSKVYKEL